MRRVTGSRTRGLIGVLMTLGLVVTACSGGEQASEESADGSGDTADPSAPAADEEGAGATAEVVRIGMANVPPSGVPWSGVGSPGQYAWSAVFDALTRIGPEGEAQPALAESWESVDETTWRFQLREGVEFQNGEPLDADAVVATFEYLLSEEGSSQYSAHSRNYSIESVTAVDDSTVEITTPEPDVLVPNVVSIVYIVPPEAWSEMGPSEFATNPIGTGPYESVAWSQQGIELERWEDSWREASMPAVEFISLGDPAARVQALQSEQVDLIRSPAPDQLVELENSGFESYVSSNGQLMSLMFISTDGGPLADQKVRQALNYAVDKQAIAEELVAGLSGPAAWPPEGVNGYDASREPYPYDPEQAQQLLAEAGYEEGFEFTAEVTVGSYPADREIYQAVAGYLSEVGVDMTLNEIDFAQDWLPKFSTAEAEWEGEAFGSTWNSPPVMDAIRPFAWNSCGWPGEWYCDQQAEDLIGQVNSTFDVEERNEVLSELLDLNMADSPSLFLVETVDLWAHQSAVEGFGIEAFNPTWDTLTVGG